METHSLFPLVIILLPLGLLTELAKRVWVPSDQRTSSFLISLYDPNPIVETLIKNFNWNLLLLKLGT